MTNNQSSTPTKHVNEDQPIAPIKKEEDFGDGKFSQSQPENSQDSSTTLSQSTEKENWKEATLPYFDSLWLGIK